MALLQMPAETRACSLQDGVVEGKKITGALRRLCCNSVLYYEIRSVREALRHGSTDFRHY